MYWYLVAWRLKILLFYGPAICWSEPVTWLLGRHFSTHTQLVKIVIFIKWMLVFSTVLSPSGAFQHFTLLYPIHLQHHWMHKTVKTRMFIYRRHVKIDRKQSKHLFRLVLFIYRWYLYVLILKCLVWNVALSIKN